MQFFCKAGCDWLTEVFGGFTFYGFILFFVKEIHKKFSHSFLPTVFVNVCLQQNCKKKKEKKGWGGWGGEEEAAHCFFGGGSSLSVAQFA